LILKLCELLLPKLMWTFLPTASGIQKAARAIWRKWWQLFGYNYVLSAIRAWQTKVFSIFGFRIVSCTVIVVNALF
jgi:hypothetical protein